MTARTLRAYSPTLWLGTLALAALAAALLWLGGCDAFPPDPPDPPDPDPPPAACEFPPVEFRLCEEAEGCNDPIWAPFFTDPAWHPDGRYIAAVHADSIDTDGDCHYDGYVNGIWLLDTETGGKRPLLEGDFAEPDWSPDGRHLALSDLAVPQIYTVEVADLDSAEVVAGSLRQLTTQNTNFAPAWSPDGQRIAFNSNAFDPSLGPEAWIMNADGSGRQRIGSVIYPRWNFSAYSLIGIGPYTDIYRVSIASPDATTRLTFFNEDNFGPLSIERVRLSPDASHLAFWAQSNDSAARYLYTLSPGGTNLCRTDPDDLLSFDWKPDSEGFVILRSQNVPDRWSGQLYTIERDGSGLRQLTDYFPAWGRCPLGC